MTTQTATPTNTALAPYTRLKELMRQDTIQKQFEEVLGQKARGFLASVLNTVWSNDYLKDCEPNSVIVGAMKAAVLDLPIDNNIGYAYLVPYREKGVKVAQFQIGYRGIIQLALRTLRYAAINAVPIFEGEEVKVDRLTGAVKLNGKQVSDKVVGYVSYFQLKDGFEKFWYMTVEEIHAHGKRYSKSYGKPESAWSTHFDAMAKKTVLRQILLKYGPLSVDLQEVLKEDESEDEDDTLLDAIMERDTEAGTASYEVHPKDTIDAIFKEAGIPTDEELAPETTLEKSMTDWIVSEDLGTGEEAKFIVANWKVNETDELACEVWIKTWRGWMDATGCTMEQAAKFANKGEAPK